MINKLEFFIKQEEQNFEKFKKKSKLKKIYKPKFKSNNN